MFTFTVWLILAIIIGKVIFWLQDNTKIGNYTYKLSEFLADTWEK